MKQWQDVFTLPLRGTDYSWVYDANGQFVFEFILENDAINKNIIDCINGTDKFKGRQSDFVYQNGIIKIKNGISFIMIRGWGYLTGTGGLNLSHEEASNIQDTFAEFIISRLNNK